MTNEKQEENKRGYCWDCGSPIFFGDHRGCR